MAVTDPEALRALIGRVAAGDRDAFESFTSATTTFIYRRCFTVLRNHEITEDTVQRVLLKVWERAGSFDTQRGSVLAWLSVISRNTSIDRIRNEEREGRRAERLMQLSPNSTEVDDHVNQTILSDTVRQALDQLPEDQRRPIELAYFGGLSYREVAQHLGVAEGTIKSRIRRGMLALGSTLGEIR